jgi:hypothetical protein
MGILFLPKILPRGTFQPRQVNNLHMYVEELENRMARLRNECPADWKSDQIEMESKFHHLKGKGHDVYANFSSGDIGG